MSATFSAFTNKVMGTVNGAIDKLPIIQDSTGLEYDTPYGTILFTKREVEYYNKLFDSLDFDDDDEVVYKEILFFLKRSKIEEKTIEEIWKIGGCTEKKKKSIERYEFFVVLKMIALYQSDDGSLEIDELTFERPLPYPDFGLNNQGPDEVEPATETEALNIAIDGTKEVGSMLKKHTVYVIKVKTSYPHFPKSSKKVERRYNDFVWLHMRLSERFPQMLIPPLPEKQFSGRFSSDFIETRRLALQTFFSNIMAEKQLSEAVDLMFFLTSTTRGIEGAQGIMGHLEKISVMETLRTVGKLVYNNKEEITDEDREFEEVDVELDRFRTTISCVSDSAGNMINKQKEIARQLDIVATGFGTLSDLAEGDENSYWNKCATSFGDISITFAGHCEDLRLNLLTPINYTKNKTLAVASLIGRRQRARAQVKSAEEAVKKKSKALSEARSKNRDKVSSAQEEVDDARDERADRRKKAREVLVGLKEGYVKFETDRYRDLLNAMTSYATSQTEFYKKSAEQWDTVLGCLGYTADDIKKAEETVANTKGPVTIDSDDEDIQEDAESDQEVKPKKSKKSKHSHKGKDKSKKHKSKKASSSEEEDDEDEDSDEDRKKKHKKDKAKKEKSKKEESTKESNSPNQTTTDDKAEENSAPPAPESTEDFASV